MALSSAVRPVRRELLLSSRLPGASVLDRECLFLTTVIL